MKKNVPTLDDRILVIESNQKNPNETLISLGLNVFKIASIKEDQVIYHEEASGKYFIEIPRFTVPHTRVKIFGTPDQLYKLTGYQKISISADLIIHSVGKFKSKMTLELTLVDVKDIVYELKVGQTLPDKKKKKQYTILKKHKSSKEWERGYVFKHFCGDRNKLQKNDSGRYIYP